MLNHHHQLGAGSRTPGTTTVTPSQKLFSSSPSISKSVPELLSTPQHALGTHKPLNPFDDAVVSNHVLTRRPGSSPNPTKDAPDINIRRSSVTIDALIKTPKTQPPTPGHPRLKHLLHQHPIRLLNYLRLLLILPLLSYVILLGLTGPDWRHNEYRMNQAGSTRTLLSLSGVERVTKTGLDTPEAAAMVSELPVSYGSVVSIGNCDVPGHAEKAETILGRDSPLDVARVTSDRTYRLAVYSLLYGPTYRDVDCRALQKFRIVGAIVKGILVGAVVLLFGEWCIVFLHCFSKPLLKDAISAYHYVNTDDPTTTTATTTAGGEFHPPPFILPSEEWVPIDVQTCTGSCAPLSTEPLPPKGVSCSVEWVEKLWWRPLSYLTAKVGRPSHLHYPLVSFLEGSSMMMGAASVALITLGLLVWSHQTDEPACLNAETELEKCAIGASYQIVCIANLLCLSHTLSHLFSAQLCRRLSQGGGGARKNPVPPPSSSRTLNHFHVDIPTSH